MFRPVIHFLGVFALCCLCQRTFGQAVEELPLRDLPAPVIRAPVSRTQIPAEGRLVLDSIQFDDTPLVQVMRALSEESGLKVIASADAGQKTISVYLKRVTAIDALDAIVKANGLFYRIDEESGIIRISTTEEYERDLASFRDEQTRVFTLLYPNPLAVAQAIQHVFGERVELNVADSDFTDLIDLSQRLNRFDLVDGRALGLGTFQGGGAFGGAGGFGGAGLGGFGGAGRGGFGGAGLGGFGGAGLGGFGGIGGLGGFGRAGLGGLGGLGGGVLQSGLSGRSRSRLGAEGRLAQEEFEAMQDLTAEQIQRLENELYGAGTLGEATRSELLRRRQATIQLSVIRRNNQLVVRTGDERTMNQIAELVLQLDVPTPLVLLEVKVLRVDLADDFESAFEYLIGRQDGVSFSDGNLLGPFPGGAASPRVLANGVGVSGTIPGSLTFQIVDENFQFRMQLLEAKNRVTALATPLILTANNEVSRIFVGDTLPFTVGFTPPQIITGVNANNTVAATPETELRDVGQSLLITPNINADRSVTLRIVEENSERVENGAQIPVPAVDGSGFTNVSVDTVRRRTVSGTIVAQDGLAVALGGLIEEGVADRRDMVPVLGRIPGLGLLFRRQSTIRSRSELIVVVRPYVFNTPSESAVTSQKLLGELSLHPNSPEACGTMETFLPCEVIRPDPACGIRANLFRFHNVVPANY